MSASGEQPRRVAVAVVVRGQRVLIQTRVGGAWQGYWEFPGGGVEVGESDEQALIRECLEEVGMSVEVLQPIECRCWSDQQRPVEVAFYLCSAADDREARPLLGQQLAWVSGEQLARRTLLPANASVIAWLAGRLGEGSPGEGVPQG